MFIYVANDIKFAIVNVCVDYSTFECASILVESKQSSAVFAVVYRPPSSHVPTFLSEFTDFLSNIENIAPTADLFVAGDFNINLLSPNSSEFCNLMLSHNVYPTIFHPTHESRHNATLIDNFFYKFLSALAEWCS